jgi:bifunctional DNA primase/polymerase-like protein
MATVPFSDTAAAGQAPSAGAVAYACSQLGFRVFPLVPGSKRPAIEGWKTKATSDLDQIREWWAGGEFTGCPVGIATGPGSGIWILDIDTKHGINGFEVFRGIASANGASVEEFTRTMTVATPSGGAHLYFRWDETADAEGGVRSDSSGHLAPNLDVKGIGGLVKAPGCGGYQVVPRGGIRSTVIVPAPGWLVELTRKPEREAREEPQFEPGSAAAERETERVLDRLGSSAPGTRNNELNVAAYRLGKMGTMSVDAAWSELRTVMFSIGANDDESSQRRTFESGWDAGRRAGNV